MSNTRSRQPGPAPIETAELIERLKQRAAGAPPAAAPRSIESPIIAHAGVVTTGRLIRHGAANYAFRSGASPSYYIELATPQGPKILWGVDLKRALTESQTHPKVGELIGVQRIGYQVVTPPREHPSGNAEGGIGESLRRTRWRIEQIAFFAEALRVARREREATLKDRDEVRDRPELRSAFVSMQLARDYAARNIRDPDDRERFLARLQEVMEASASSVRPRTRVHDPDGPAR